MMKITRHGIAVLENDTHISKWVEESGKIDHNQNIEQTFRRFFGEGDTVVDVGAFIGDHTIPYAQIVGPEGRVLAFEVNAPTFQCLQHNAQNYPWVECYCAGLSDEVKSLNVVGHENAGASHLSDKTKYMGNPSVQVGPLDDLNLETCAFIKIDVEGMELDVLRGAVRTIKRKRPALMIEVATHQARYGRTAEDVFHWLAGLEDYTITPPAHTGAPQYDLVAIPNERK